MHTRLGLACAGKLLISLHSRRGSSWHRSHGAYGSCAVTARRLQESNSVCALGVKFSMSRSPPSRPRPELEPERPDDLHHVARLEELGPRAGDRPSATCSSPRAIPGSSRQTERATPERSAPGTRRRERASSDEWLLALATNPPGTIGSTGGDGRSAAVASLPDGRRIERRWTIPGAAGGGCD